MRRHLEYLQHALVLQNKNNYLLIINYLNNYLCICSRMKQVYWLHLDPFYRGFFLKCSSLKRMKIRKYKRKWMYQFPKLPLFICRAGPPVLNSHSVQQMGWLWSVMLMYIYVGLGVCACLYVCMMYVCGAGKLRPQKAAVAVLFYWLSGQTTVLKS